MTDVHSCMDTLSCCCCEQNFSKHMNLKPVAIKTEMSCRLYLKPRTCRLYLKPRTCHLYLKPRTCRLYLKPRTCSLYLKPRTCMPLLWHCLQNLSDATSN